MDTILLILGMVALAVIFPPILILYFVGFIVFWKDFTDTKKRKPSIYSRKH